MTQSALPSPLDRWVLGEAELLLTTGELLAPPAQGVLCYSSTALTLHSAAAVQIVERGGPVVRTDAAKHNPGRVGDALVLTAGRLPFHYVLVAVTNELRARPTLDGLRAALATALDRAAALQLESLALPLLRARRSADDDAMLVVTLAALVAHLSGPTSLRRVWLVVGDEDAQARATVRRVAPLFGLLAEVGALRAQARVCGTAAALLARLRAEQGRASSAELLVARSSLLAQAARRLEPPAAAAAVPGGAGLGAELRSCRAELALAGQGAEQEREAGG
ncbi:MAG TPA: macro domain-containing protein [Chloroflexaceae bacterium]|nr:macro domain-containing protein [Chloroflexaceae bacterium]